jgi:hypothetical protein
MADEATTRREVLKKAAYTTPILLTLKANLEFASAGSGLPPSNDRVITGRPELPNPGEPTSGSTKPPTATPSGPGSPQPPSPSAPAPVSPELPPPDNPAPDNPASPPDDAPDTTPRPRRRRRHRRWGS